MKFPVNKKFWLFTIVLLLAVPTVALRLRSGRTNIEQPSKSSFSSMPPVILWAWERPENLTFIDPNNVGVAYLAGTIYLRGDDVVVKPRLQPLTLREGTKLIAVVRIETDQENRPTFTSTQSKRITSAVSSLAAREGVLAAQIDFDATVSERDFYRELLSEVRSALPNHMPLSITALASWCAGDKWLANLPIDEAVPMLFRMGVERRQFAARLQSGYRFPASPCNTSAGVSTDELIPNPQVKRLYIFNPNSWTQTSFNKTLEAYKL